MAFDEDILCDLTRSVQDCNGFGYYAFRPVSRPGRSSVKSVDDMSDDQTLRITPRDDDLLHSSDRSKYRQALAIQRVRSDPDSVNVDLTYHLAWNAAHRKPVFSHPADARRLIDDVFSACGKQIGGFASVLWLAPDHLHVYFETDGERSIETVVKVLKRVSSQALRTHLARGASSSRKGGLVWEGAYFAETIG